jgi:8-oxo-dGTP diphosphatase
MGKRQKTRWVESRAIIQNSRHEVLIFKADRRNDSALWEFPGGRVAPGESPEVALRRHCRLLLAVELELQIGQPPFVHDFGDHQVTYRYYHCAADAVKLTTSGAAETRWVRVQQLPDYTFDPPTQVVVDWLRDAPAAG